MLKKYFPIFEWASHYTQETFQDDLIAAIVVTFMLIPQSLAYAILAGLPAEYGLYASILPLVVYMFLGTSRTLAVGPVAVASLMTASAIGKIAETGSPEFIAGAIALALISGLMLMLMGLARLGFLANFLSHPVISGFITASGILIALSQVRHILGVKAHGETLPQILSTMWEHINQFSIVTFLIGASTIAFLVWVRKSLKGVLVNRFKLTDRQAGLLSKTAPIVAVFVSIVLVFVLRLWDWGGVKVVGEIPRGLPTPTLPTFNLDVWKLIFVPALLISIVGYVETISVAQTLAAKRRQRVDPDQELIALGAANVSSAISAGFPVTGGFSRSVVNFDAGAQTPLAGGMTAIGIAFAALFLTPALYYLPIAVLAATIIVAVLSLIDTHAMRHVYDYSKTDFMAMMATILVTLFFGVEAGIITGVGLSLFLHLMSETNPHYAVVGQVPDTEHFRNVLRHEVKTSPNLLTIRVDSSLYFLNARFLEDMVNEHVAKDKTIKNVVLMCPAVNRIDVSALESLEAINLRLKDAGIGLHLSEVKGPVMDKLKGTSFLKDLNGEVFLNQYQAFQKLA